VFGVVTRRVLFRDVSSRSRARIVHDPRTHINTSGPCGVRVVCPRQEASKFPYELVFCLASILSRHSAWKLGRTITRQSQATSGVAGSRAVAIRSWHPNSILSLGLGWLDPTLPSGAVMGLDGVRGERQGTKRPETFRIDKRKNGLESSVALHISGSMKTLL